MTNTSMLSQGATSASVSNDCTIAVGYVVFDAVCLAAGAVELRAGISASAAADMAEAVWPVASQIEVVIYTLSQEGVTAEQQAWGIFKILGIIYKGGCLPAVGKAFQKTLTWYNMILYGVSAVAVIVSALATDGVALVAFIVAQLVAFAFLVEDCVKAVSACSISSAQPAVQAAYGAESSGNYFITDRQPSLYAVGDELYVAFRSASNQTLSNSFSTDGQNWYYPPISVNIMQIEDSPNGIAFNGQGLVAFPSVYANTTAEKQQTAPASPAKLLQLFSNDLEGTIVQDVYMGSPGSMCELNGEVLLAFQANDSSHTMYVTKSTDGVTWQAPATAIKNVQIGSAPALANFNGTIYCAYKQNTSRQELYYTISTDGFTWETPQPSYVGIIISGSPSLTVLNGKLYIAFLGSDGHSLYSGVYIENPPWQYALIPGVSAGSSPSICAYNGSLYIAYMANDGSQAILYVKSSDGTTWSSPQPLNGVFAQ
ncbi:sialidase family protein [Trinickia fusca]|uniref:Exo-alpha-sialidase n=1 Tax=Trinickia fusca TaxID=2419777 RepID=A0A494XAN9_9BURK|nr:sialidase family protein [Trinickia fusca]RKP45174.1 exo-alpha-sialidase [Trinickia fusca]